ncbi:MAG: MBL fold metallo-hydrolase [bacterium]|nr:MBL fold metallo-hydrolase [bacterium]
MGHMDNQDKDLIKFLGTAGARFVVAKQLRSSAGVFIRFLGKNIILDPGPGTLVKCATSKPPIDVSKIDSIILTHAHIDHSTDVNVMIDAMTSGGLKKRGILFATGESLSGDNSVVLNYLRTFLEDIVTLRENERYNIGDLQFETSIRHNHQAETYGIRFNLPNQDISFMVDTKYFPGLIESYKNSDILIMNVVRYTPHEKGEVLHLCVEDVKEILRKIKPKKAIMTHFGMTMLKAKPWELAKRLSEEFDVEVVCATDGMKIEVGNRFKNKG